jgi:hypothetical protein
MRCVRCESHDAARRVLCQHNGSDAYGDMWCCKCVNKEFEQHAMQTPITCCVIGEVWKLLYVHRRAVA